MDDAKRIAGLLGTLCEADRELARCLDLLNHIRSLSRYPNSDGEAQAEFEDYLETAEAARARLAPQIVAVRAILERQTNGK